MVGGRPALCIEIFPLFGFYFVLIFWFVFHSTLDLQACALWAREYFSVKCGFCHSIEIIKIKKKLQHSLDVEGVADSSDKKKYSGK